MADNQLLGDLLARCALKDQAAFASLYDASSAHLYAIALRILRQDEAAQDAVQEAYVRIWQNAGEYRVDRGTPLTWMGSITRYRALDRLRRNRAAPSDGADELPELADDEANGPLEAFKSGQQAGVLQDCLETLKSQQRQCLILAYYRGLTHEELSTQLGSPLGTVKSWVRRGLERLKRCLES